MVQGSDTKDLYCIVQADVPLSQMFGFSTDLRSATQGKGEFTMEYVRRTAAPPAFLHWDCPVHACFGVPMYVCVFCGPGVVRVW